MAAKPFHTAWFLQGSSIQAWGEAWTGNISEEWMSPDMFLDLCKAIERACFDYMLIEDSIYVGEMWQGSRDIYLKNGMSIPRQEPSMVATLMSAATKHLGIVPTLSTFAYHPYLTARIMSTLDQFSGGRSGWNMVTGSADFAAQNFGQDRLPDHDLRYDMADEYIDIVTKLWDSWEPGAIVANRETGVLVDPAKVHPIDFSGEFYRSRGPLNSGPCPQGRPVIAQAGGSERGRTFAAKHAETIVVHMKGIEQMKAYREDVRRRMVEFGRDPDTCKVLFLIAPILAETDEDARERASRRMASAAKNVDVKLAQLGWSTNIDFSIFDLDQPVGDLPTNGHQQSLTQLLCKANKPMLREAMTEYGTLGTSFDLIGTPDSVAAKMDEVMQAVSGDGFLFALPNVNRRNVAEIIDGLFPVLQQRGLARRAYAGKHLRDNLLEF